MGCEYVPLILGSAIGLFLVDPDPPNGEPAMIVSSAPVPEWAWAAFSEIRKRHIIQAELLAMVCAYYTVGHRLRGRKVVHWGDNTGAVATAIGATPRFAGSAVLVCMLFLALLRLRCSVYFDWVPSEANPADWPTRPEKAAKIPAAAQRIPMRLPPQYLFRSIMSAEAVLLWMQALAHWP